MKKFFYGLQLLEELSSFKCASPEGDSLSRRYNMLQGLFDYFLRCLSVSRGLKQQYSTDKCPGEADIVFLAMKELAQILDHKWTAHKDECYACNHASETYRLLIENIWQVLYTDGYLLAVSAILSYLRNDPDDIRSKIFSAMKKIDTEQRHDIHGNKVKRVRGILAVKQDDASGESRCWYGLIRRAMDVMDSTICVLYPPTPESPVFRVNITNELDGMYLMLLNGKPEAAQGLHFFFSEDNTGSLRNGCFVAHATGTSWNKSVAFNGWEAILYGKVL